MKQSKYFLKLLLATTIPVIALTSHARQSDFGLSTTMVTTSITKKIDKNLGKLRIAISVDCQNSAEDATQAVQTVKAKLQASAEQELSYLGLADASLDKDSDIVRPRTNKKYTLSYPKKDSTVMAYSNNCSNESIKLDGLSIDEINKMNNDITYGSTLTMTYVAKKKIAKLIELKQHLADVVSDLNAADKAANGSKAVAATVAFPTFEIDEATQEKLKAELSSKLGLDSQDTQISVDEAFFRKYTGSGFAEKYVNTNDRADITYSQTQPKLLDDGQVQLQKFFYFTVSYLPSNLGSDKTVVPGAQSKNFTVETDMKLQESDVESYVSVIGVSTKCQASRADANTTFKRAFNEAKAAAEKELAKSGPSDANAVRIDNVQSPYESYSDKVVGRKLVEYIVEERDFAGTNTPVKKERWEDALWLDSCTGKISTKEGRQKYWSVSQSFKVVTDSFATYQEVKKLAKDSVGQASPGVSYLERQQHPIVVPQNLPVVLKDENWRKAVDAEMYKQALHKLTDPDGAVAKHLSNKNVQATTAYYSLGQPTNDIFPRNEFEAIRSAAPAPAPVLMPYDGSRIIVDQSNLSPHEEKAAKSYTITWRPEVDLIGLIEARSKLNEKSGPGSLK